MKKRFIIYLFGLLMLASCNNQIDPGSVVTPAGNTPLSVSAVSISGTVGTKAAQTSGSIGVFRTTANGYTALNNVQYTYSSGWATSSPIYLNTAAASVCGYYPYGAAGITGSTDPTAVTLTSQKYDTAKDLCYSTLVSTPTAGSPGVSFAMNHAYARLTINITHGVTYSGTCAISNVSIANAGIKTSSTLNMTTGTYGTGTAGTVSYDPSIASIASGSSTSTQVLLVPVTTAMTGNLDLSFTVDGIVKTASLAVATNSLSTLVAGGNYNINIQIGGNAQPESNCYIVAPGATIYIPVSRASTANSANFSTTDAFTTGLLWSDKSATHVDATVSGRYIKVVATATEGNSVVYAMKGSTIVWSWHIWVTSYVPNTTTINYNGKVWMDRNLGASASGTGTTAYGLYYQWGRKDPFPGGTSKTMLTTYGSSPATTSASTTPVSLVTSIQNPNTFYKSTSSPNDWLTPQNNALWNNSGKTVYDPCPDGWRVPLNTEFSGKFPDNTLAGILDRDGTFSYATSSGYWWSGVNDTYGARYFYSDGFVTFYSRAVGMSVRCVKN